MSGLLIWKHLVSNVIQLNDVYTDVLNFFKAHCEFNAEKTTEECIEKKIYTTRP